MRTPNYDTINKIEQWGLWHAITMIAFSMVCIYLGNLSEATLLPFISFIILLSHFQRSAIINWPNGITLFRLVGILLSFLLFSENRWVLAILLTMMVLLDILDGYLARKLNQSSTLGLHLDMEVDAIFVLTMCLYYSIIRDVQYWILVPGLLRYVYVVYINIYRKKDFQEQKQKYASIIAGVFFVLLLIGIILPDNYLTCILLPGTIAIAISFGISFIQHIRWSSQS